MRIGMPHHRGVSEVCTICPYVTIDRRLSGLLTTCEQEERYLSMGAVFIACADVQRRCAPPQIVEPSQPLEPGDIACPHVQYTK